jgi:hypothetical protein
MGNKMLILMVVTKMQQCGDGDDAKASNYLSSGND